MRLYAAALLGFQTFRLVDDEEAPGGDAERRLRCRGDAAAGAVGHGKAGRLAYRGDHGTFGARPRRDLDDGCRARF